MSKHAPGPWQIIKFPEAVIIACNPKIDRCATICELPMPSTDEEAEEIEASTRLIAAAPQMLEALEAARLFIENGIEMGYISEPQPGTPESATLPAIKAAIKAAKGEV